jgi:uncharacterized protein YuzE
MLFSTGGSERHTMKAKYFPDTDTLLVNFSAQPILETRDLNENVLVELGRNGRVVSMTIEHAAQQTNVREFSYELASPEERASSRMAVREPAGQYASRTRKRKPR